MQTSFPGQQLLEALSVRQGRARELLAKALEEQQQSGFFHTLLEICRQPQTWRETCELMIKSTAAVNASLRGAKSLIFTGSVSSEYAGDCFSRVVYLGSGARYGAAREAALKMLEMTAGRVTSLYESYLGLRHGPMSCIDSDYPSGLFYLFRPNEARPRNGPPSRTLPEAIPTDVTGPEDVVVECRGLKQLGDRNAVLVDAVVAQLLAFFRCMQEGLPPGSPSR